MRVFGKLRDSSHLKISFGVIIFLLSILVVVYFAEHWDETLGFLFLASLIFLIILLRKTFGCFRMYGRQKKQLEGFYVSLHWFQYFCVLVPYLSLTIRYYSEAFITLVLSIPGFNSCGSLQNFPCGSTDSCYCSYFRIKSFLL